MQFQLKASRVQTIPLWSLFNGITQFMALNIVDCGECVDLFIQLGMSSEQVHLLYKADISFHGGYINYRLKYRQAIAIHLFEVIMFAIFIPIDCTLMNIGEKMIAALAIAAADSVISLLIIIYQYYVLFVKTSILSYCLLAREINHATGEPVTSLQSIEDCTSNTMLHIASGVQVEGLAEQVVKVYSNIAQSQIEQMNELRIPMLSSWSRIYSFLAMGTMIVVIVLLASSGNPNPAEIVILVVFIVLEAILKLKIIILLIIIVLSPIICIVLVFYVCCCRPRERQGMRVNLQARVASTEDIVKSGGDCAICLMSIKMGESIVQLKCSDKHIFHEGCLQNWSRVKANCPVCRSDLPLTQSNEELHPQ